MLWYFEYNTYYGCTFSYVLSVVSQTSFLYLTEIGRTWLIWKWMYIKTKFQIHIFRKYEKVKFVKTDIFATFFINFY